MSEKTTSDCRQNAFGQHSRSVFLVLGSKSVYLINNKHFWVPLFPFLAIIFASFFRFMQANVSPTFISIRAFSYHLCIAESVVFFLLFRRGALRSLSVAHTLPSSQSYAGYPHTFPCTAPRYAGSLPSHDPCFLCTASDMDILHR